MTTRELFKRRVIELIHGLPYEEAISKEIEAHKGIGNITIGRVLKALTKKYDIDFFDKVIFAVDVWNLTKENGQEADDDFQRDETIELLYQLIK